MEAIGKQLASSGRERVRRRVLMCKDGGVRSKAFKTLRSWIKGRCKDLEYKEYLRLWKALFYCTLCSTRTDGRPVDVRQARKPKEPHAGPR